jgi:hypothetical protein
LAAENPLGRMVRNKARDGVDTSHVLWTKDDWVDCISSSTAPTARQQRYSRPGASAISHSTGQVNWGAPSRVAACFTSAGLPRPLSDQAAAVTAEAISAAKRRRPGQLRPELPGQAVVLGKGEDVQTPFMEQVDLLITTE